MEFNQSLQASFDAGTVLLDRTGLTVSGDVRFNNSAEFHRLVVLVNITNATPPGPSTVLWDLHGLQSKITYSRSSIVTTTGLNAYDFSPNFPEVDTELELSLTVQNFPCVFDVKVIGLGEAPYTIIETGPSPISANANTDVPGGAGNSNSLPYQTISGDMGNVNTPVGIIGAPGQTGARLVICTIMAVNGTAAAGANLLEFMDGPTPYGMKIWGAFLSNNQSNSAFNFGKGLALPANRALYGVQTSAANSSRYYITYYVAAP